MLLNVNLNLYFSKYDVLVHLIGEDAKGETQTGFINCLNHRDLQNMFLTVLVRLVTVDLDTDSSEFQSYFCGILMNLGKLFGSFIWMLRTLKWNYRSKFSVLPQPLGQVGCWWLLCFFFPLIPVPIFTILPEFSFL